MNGVTVNLDVIGKDAELEMNNNNNNEGLIATKGLMPNEESKMLEAEPESVMIDEMAKETENDEQTHIESEMGSMTDNGTANIVQNEPTDADLEVKQTTMSEASDEKTEPEPTEQTETSDSTETSESSSETIVSEKDEAHIEPESGTSEIVIEKAIETPQGKEVVSSEQSGDDAHQNEAKIEKEEEEENGTVTAAEKKDDAQTETEQKDDGANETVKNDTPKRSPRKKGSNKKKGKNRSRSQKKQADYSNLVEYTVTTSQRQRRYSLHVPRGRVIDAPGDDCEIFCSNIPINVLEGELIPLFERYGKIWELRLMMSMRNPKRNAGFAFVRYTTSEAAKEATDKLNKYEILPGKLIAIRLSQPNLSLFVGNIHRSLTREQIHEKISSRTDGKRFISFVFF